MRGLGKYISGFLLSAGLLLSSCKSFTANTRSTLHKPISIEFNDSDRSHKVSLQYVSFSDLNFEAYQNQRVNSSQKLLAALNSDLRDFQLDVEYPCDGTVTNIILEDIRSAGLEEKVSRLSAREAVVACSKIVAERITYRDVDSEKLFFNEDGTSPPLERYLQERIGDCEVYSFYFKKVFDFMKERNPSLRNIFVSPDAIGESNPSHAWDSLAIPLEDRLIVTHIDPTLFDSSNELETLEGTCLPKSNREFAARVLRSVDFDQSEKMFSDIYKTFRPDQTEDKKRVLLELAWIDYVRGNLPSLNTRVDFFCSLPSLGGDVSGLSRLIAYRSRLISDFFKKELERIDGKLDKIQETISLLDFINSVPTKEDIIGE